MAVAGYFDYGGSPADYVVDTTTGLPISRDASGNLLQFYVYNSPTAGTRITDLKDASGAATAVVSPVDTGVNKGIVAYQAPTSTKGVVYLDKRDGTPRITMIAPAALAALASNASAADVQNAITAADNATTAANNAAAQLTTAQSQFASIEEHTPKGGNFDLWPQGSGTVSRTQVNPIALDLCVVLQSIQVKSLSLVFKSWNFTGDASNYWTFTLQRWRAGAATTIVAKTTLANGGEAVTAETPWTFDAFTFDANNSKLIKGDVLRLNCVPTPNPATTANEAFMPLRWDATYVLT